LSQLAGLFTNNLLPIFLAAGVGFLLASRFSVSPRALSQVSFYIFSPCLVFSLLTHSELSSGDVISMSLFSVLNMLIIGLVVGLAALLLRLDRRLTAALLVSTMLVNAGNYGLPVILFAFGTGPLAYGTLYFIVMMIMAYTVGVFTASLGSLKPGAALRNLARVPVVYAVGFALLFLATGWIVPLPLERTINLLGEGAIPSMLVLMGMQFAGMRLEGRVLPLALGSAVRLVLSPVLAFGLARFMQLPESAMQAGILQAGMPTAVLTIVLATEFDAEPAFVTAMVFTTTLLSPLTLTPLLALLGG
jgi:malate permease and related proteins